MKGFGRKTWTLLGVAGLALLLYAALTAKGGVPDPTEEANLSTGAVILNSGLLVLREGLEAILVLAAVIASFRGANRLRRRPVLGRRPDAGRRSGAAPRASPRYGRGVARMERRIAPRNPGCSPDAVPGLRAAALHPGYDFVRVDALAMARI